MYYWLSDRQWLRQDTKGATHRTTRCVCLFMCQFDGFVASCHISVAVVTVTGVAPDTSVLVTSASTARKRVQHEI